MEVPLLCGEGGLVGDLESVNVLLLHLFTEWNPAAGPNYGYSRPRIYALRVKLWLGVVRAGLGGRRGSLY